MLGFCLITLQDGGRRFLDFNLNAANVCLTFPWLYRRGFPGLSPVGSSCNRGRWEEGNSKSQIGSRRNRHGEIERCWGFQDRQSVFFLWVLKRDLCHLQTKPHFLWLSPLKYSICQCHGPSQRAASHVCWLSHSPIYIRHWQHHCVPNVLLACCCSILCRDLFSSYFPSQVHYCTNLHRLLSWSVQNEINTVWIILRTGNHHSVPKTLRESPFLKC